MESHIRVKIQANWDALRYLSCATYKVLICLVQRADPYGRCFPSVEKIAEDTGLHIQTVYKSLQTLEDTRYIGYLRRNECDPITGRFVPNVYIVSPYFICIAEDNQVEVIALWKSVYGDFVAPMPFESISYINQQQEPPSENLHHITNTKNQQQQPPFASESVKTDEISQDASDMQKKQKSKTASQIENESSRTQQREAPQRSENGRSSAIVKKYANPDPMPAPLPDAIQEQLAERVNCYGLPMPLARGMILAHGYELVKIAANQLDATAQHQSIDNPGGFFRYLLEQRILDSGLPGVLQEAESERGELRYAVGRWAKFFAGDDHETE